MAFKYRGLEVRGDLKEMITETPMDVTNLIGSRVLPEIGVRQTGGTIAVMPAGTAHRPTSTERADGGAYSRSTFNLTEDSFTTKVFGAEEGVDLISKIATSDILDEETVAATIARNRLLLSREKRVADAIMNTTTFTGAKYTGAVGTAWDDSAADFRSDIRDAGSILRERLGVDLSGLSLILTMDRVRDMVETLAGLDSIKYTQTIDLQSDSGRVSALKQFIGVKEIITGDAMGNSAGLGLDSKFEFLWANDKAMLTLLSPATQSWKLGGLGRQPVFSKLTNDYIMESYDQESHDMRWVRAKEQRGEKVFKDFGYLLTGLV